MGLKMPQPISLKRIAKFSEDQPINPKNLETELENVVSYINQNVVAIPRVNQNKNGIRFIKEVIVNDSPGGGDGGGGGTTDPWKPWLDDPRASVRSLTAEQTIEGNAYPSIEIGKKIDFDGTGSDISVLIGQIPAGYVISDVKVFIITAFDDLKIFRIMHNNYIFAQLTDSTGRPGIDPTLAKTLYEASFIYTDVLPMDIYVAMKDSSTVGSLYLVVRAARVKGI